MDLHTVEEMQNVINLNPDGSFTADGKTFTSDVLRRRAQTAEIIDQETGEVTPSPAPTPETPKPPQEQPNLIEEPTCTFAQVNAMLIKSKSVQVPDEIADYIRFVPNEQYQDELRKVYQSMKNPD